MLTLILTLTLTLTLTDVSLTRSGHEPHRGRPYAPLDRTHLQPLAHRRGDENTRNGHHQDVRRNQDRCDLLTLTLIGC